jgi:GT2 family glycosyltransferase
VTATRPRVRVVVVNYRGGALTVDCLRSVVETTWPATALEVVLVDNASGDGVIEQVRRELPVVRVIESPTNVGFGAACNLAMRDLGGVEYVALVNNDVTVTPAWLAPLVDAIEHDPGIGAACPKILLADRFRSLTLTAPTTRRGRGDRRDLGVRISGIRAADEDLWRRVRFVTGTWGPEYGVDDEEQFQWTGDRADLLVPALADVVSLRLDADDPRTVTATSGGATTRFQVGPTAGWHDVTITGEPFDVINNTGTELHADAYGADRGYLERDAGQYDTAGDVFAWCAAAVVLSTHYLDDVGRFDEALFLYYEDLDLAWRGHSRGWRTRYVPDSVVRHVHSATSSQQALATMFQNERNHLTVAARHLGTGEVARTMLRHLAITASYARRDVVAPVLQGRPARPAVASCRLRAFGSALRTMIGRTDDGDRDSVHAQTDG